MTFKKLKIIHIHTDYKFVDSTSQYNGNYFINEVIIIKGNKPYNGAYEESALFFEHTKNDMNKIIQICNQYDLVILYDLTHFKMGIALGLSPEVKIAWRFFGYELYWKMPEFCYSEKTKIALKPDWRTRFIKSILNLRNLTNFLLPFFTNEKSLFKKAIKRINYFLSLCPEEYEYLKVHFPYLPPLIKLSINFNVTSKVFNIESKSNIVVIGNNRSAYNNHLDIIEIISKMKTVNNIEFQLLFNYGEENNYTKSVRDYANRCLNINIIENFMPIEEFNSYYKRVSAFVLNGFRQMALGNIFTAIINGVKIYLNEKNIILYWLKNEGFIIYTIEDFENDIKSNNIKLSISQIQYNIDQWNKFSSRYSLNDFQNSIYKKVLANNKR